jgi:protease-4
MPDTQQSPWERETIEKLLLSTIKEQRSRRRWGVFFKLIFLFITLALIAAAWSSGSKTTAAKNKPHVSLIDIRGQISDEGANNARNIIAGLHRAYNDKNTKAIILDINSAGGSPVQANIVYDEITYLRNSHKNIKVYAICSDVCASASYYIASAADDIYADPSSLIGSIGVLMKGFGFVDSLKKLGMTRRLMTSGSHKGFMDPFTPVSPDDEKIAQGLLDSVHSQFIQKVKEGRGSRLKDESLIFSGIPWTGSQALTLGLIDGFGNVYSVMRNVIKIPHVVNYTVKQSFFSRFTHSMQNSLSPNIGNELDWVMKAENSDPALNSTTLGRNA